MNNIIIDINENSEYVLTSQIDELQKNSRTKLRLLDLSSKYIGDSILYHLMKN